MASVCVSSEMGRNPLKLLENPTTPLHLWHSFAVAQPALLNQRLSYYVPIAATALYGTRYAEVWH